LGLEERGGAWEAQLKGLDLTRRRPWKRRRGIRIVSPAKKGGERTPVVLNIVGMLYDVTGRQKGYCLWVKEQ